MKCPNCQGGKIRGYGCPGFRPVEIDCDICGGTGELPDHIEYDRERGRQLKEDRKKHRLTLQEEAIRCEINITDLSRMERGYFTRRTNV